MLKIDVFPHILPRPYFDRIMSAGPSSLPMGKRMAAIPVLVDLDARLRIMDRYEGYRQVLTIANPPLETLGGPDVTPDLASIANDSMAEIVLRHPERFPGFVASLPMNNPDAALREIDRAIDDLGGDGRPDVHERRRTAPRRAALPAPLRAHGRAAAPDLAPPRAAASGRRLRRRTAVEV
jgi:uncharacterized protein